MDIIAQTQGITSHPDGTEVQVEVAGPRAVPDTVKSVRARARALISSGVLPTTRDSVEDITMGEIKRFTRVEGKPVRERAGTLVEAKLFTVVVNRDT